MQNPRLGINLTNDIIPEVLIQFLVNPLNLAIHLGMVRG